MKLFAGKQCIGLVAIFSMSAVFYAYFTYTTYYERFSASWVGNYGIKNLPRIVRWTSFSQQKEENQNNRIFFLETTGNNKLNLRQVCAVESAAKENPDKPIQLLMIADDMDGASPMIPVLNNYSNVVIVLINATEYFSNSPLEEWYQSIAWRNGPYRVEHFADYTRILSLYKAGGLYMDLDFVTLKGLDRNIFWNFVTEEDNGVLTNSAIHLEKGHPILHLMVEYLAKSYFPDRWTHAGPVMIQDSALKFCGKSSPEPLYPENMCKDLKVLPRNFMYPYPYYEWQRFFAEDASPLDNAFNSYALHMYNKLSKKQPIIVGSNQIYSKVARDHCPLAYAQAIDSF